MPQLTEFHRGWMIEITHIEGRFQTICYSPNGSRLYDRTGYLSSTVAWQVAMELIDQYFVRIALKRFLREQYEIERLTFEEWQQLHQSLDKFTWEGTPL
ncbi:hypothetical protein [Pantanalinema sp. GBBB05]|uniref:hypothetical protein n=1 Tax=Pantanalinema sp. GBBB05 TaxID=2604139 RepID=UPI001DCE0D90|nr:hypothetical protein [Pantanalinema sp. GBBB05]